MVADSYVAGTDVCICVWRACWQYVLHLGKDKEAKTCDVNGHRL